MLVSIHRYLTRDVRLALIEFSVVFKDLYARILNVEALDRMKWKITIIMYKLESSYLLSLFDIIVHLTVHLPCDDRLAWPVQYRWIYPIERFIWKLKHTVGNEVWPQGLTAEAYIDGEWLKYDLCGKKLEKIKWYVLNNCLEIECHLK